MNTYTQRAHNVGESTIAKVQNSCSSLPCLFSEVTYNTHRFSNSFQGKQISQIFIMRICEMQTTVLNLHFVYFVSVILSFIISIKKPNGKQMLARKGPVRIMKLLIVKWPKRGGCEYSNNNGMSHKPGLLLFSSSEIFKHCLRL